MGTRANPGTFDCYAAAADDEPIFTLRANDPLAANMVRIWADEYLALKSLSGGLDEKAVRKLRDARICADAMDAWRDGS